MNNPEKQTPKILLIDDDPLVLKSLKNVLERKGYTVTSASGPEEGIQTAESDEFDLVISDIRMPRKNGIEVIEKIQDIQKEHEKKSAFMFITGYADDDAPQHATRLGVTEFILKPFDIEKLVAAVERQFELSGSREPRKKFQSHDVEVVPEMSSIGKWKFPEKKFTFTKLILLKPTNVMGNTYYDNYLSWQGEARERLLLSHPDVGLWMETNRHIKMITHSIYHRFLGETTFGDIVRIEATIREIKRCSFIMVFRFFNEKTNAILGEGWQTICFSDFRSGKLCPVPQLILDLIEPINEEQANTVQKVN